MTELISIATASLSAEISLLGAELQILRDARGRDLLFDGDPTFWAGRAPILFPIVGAVHEGVIRVGGMAYPMARHGFARRSLFKVIAQSALSTTLRLTADDETRLHYPFDFQLDISFTIEAASLEVRATLTNPGATILPASLGYHPAFRWPLPGNERRRDDHRLIFPEDEPAPIRQLDAAGLLRPDPHPTPVQGNALRLTDDLFVGDALILDALRSRRVCYGIPGEPMIEVSFPRMPLLGVWTKPGAPFVCIEPWQGIADPQGYSGEFQDKPGIVQVAPGASHDFVMTIALI